MDDTLVGYEVDDPVAVITLNRPEKLNALTYPMLKAFRSAVDAAEADRRVVGIVITGAGRGFCAGLDAEVLKATTSPGGRSVAEGGAPAPSDEVPGLFTYLLAVGKPVIAAVNGPAAGGGFVLAVMSDIRFASTAGSFTTVFSKRGLISEHGTSWILPRLLGAGRALDLLWSSRKVDAAEALRLGLVEDVVEPDDLLARARRYVVELAEVASPGSLRDTKRLVYAHLGIGYPDALREADRVQWEAIARPDALEGALSLIERRPPNFARIGAEEER
jgi:enoyl-CoA hydratase/carnithine racemase